MKTMAHPRFIENPDDFILGVTAAPVALETREENRIAACALARQARSHLCIFTRDLDPPLYDDLCFLDAVTALATRSRFARVRVLVQNSEKAVKYGHRLIELSRRLSSFIQLRRPHADYQDYNEAFLVADGVGLLHRALAHRYEAEVDFKAPLRARLLLKFFDEAWDKSEPDLELRRLHI